MRADSTGAPRPGSVPVSPRVIDRVPAPRLVRARREPGGDWKAESPSPGRRVLRPRVADRVLAMLETVIEPEGTGEYAELEGVRVAGKTGSLSGRDPKGRYEWFIGAAPADEPRLAVAVVIVQGSLWWVTPSQVAAEILKVAFCPKGVCSAAAADRWLQPGPVSSGTPTLVAFLSVPVATSQSHRSPSLRNET